MSNPEEKDSNNGGPSGEGFSVKVHQVRMLYKIVRGEEYGNKKSVSVPISNTDFDDRVLESEETSLRTDFKLPNALIAAIKGEKETPPGDRGFNTFLLRSELKPSEARLMRVDQGYYSENRIQRIQGMLTEFGNKVELFPDGFSKDEFERGQNFLLIKHRGIYVEVKLGYPSRDIHIDSVKAVHLTEDEESFEEEILPNLEDAPRSIILLLRGRDPKKNKSVFINRFASELDFMEQVCTYATVYEHLIKAIYAEQDVALPQKSIIFRPPILDQDSLAEMQSLETEQPKTVVEEQVMVEKYTFKDIAGQDEAVKQAKRVVFAINNTDRYQRWGAKKPKGVLLYGPPGSGKTLLAKIIANETNAKFFEVAVNDIGSKWYGESEKLMQRVFNKANRATADGSKVIIFFDEIEALAPNRSEAYEGTRKVISILLQNLDGLRSNPNVTVVAATNLPDDIDPAIKRTGRFDKFIEVGLPSDQGRLDIFYLHLTKAFERATVKDALYKYIKNEEIIKITEGMSGADIENLVNLVIEEKTMAVEEKNIPWEPITTQDLIDVVEMIRKEREQKRKMGFVR